MRLTIFVLLFLPALPLGTLSACFAAAVVDYLRGGGVSGTTTEFNLPAVFEGSPVDIRHSHG